jgi:hypothetical protein
VWIPPFLLQLYIEVCKGNFTQNKKAIVPWLELSADNSKYLSSDSLLADISLQEPTKMKMDEISAFWEHWRTQQAVGSVGISFQDAVPRDFQQKANGKGKKKVSSEDFSEDEVQRDMDEDEEEGDKEDDGDEAGGVGENPVTDACPPTSSAGLNSPSAHQNSEASRLEYLQSLSTMIEFQLFCQIMQYAVFHLYVCYDIGISD